MAAPIISSVNQKGGTGKTTTSRILAQTLADMPSFHGGKPILVIDLDPQGNTSSRWRTIRTCADGTRAPIPHPALLHAFPELEGLSEEELALELDGHFHHPVTSSICDLWLDHITDGGQPVTPVPYPTYNPMIDIVPADEKLMEEISSVPKHLRDELGDDVTEWLRSDQISDHYSCVIIDTAPVRSPLNKAAIKAATHVYVPFVPEPQSMEGIFSIISLLRNIERWEHDPIPLEFMGFLPNLVMPNTGLHREHLSMLRDSEVFAPYLMPAQLNRRVAYAETDDWNNSPDKVTDYKGSNAEFEVMRFAKEVAKRVKQSKDAGHLDGGAFK